MTDDGSGRRSFWIGLVALGVLVAVLVLAVVAIAAFLPRLAPGL
jgi:hypothetical protein